MKVKIIFYILIVVIYIEFSECQLQSPCPEVFQYVNDGNEKYGVVTYSGAEPGQHYLMDIEISVEGNLPSTFSSRIRVLEGINEKNEIRYKLTYPSQNLIPRIVEIQMNKQTICSGPTSSKYGVTTIKLNNKYQTDIPLSTADPTKNNDLHINPVPSYIPKIFTDPPQEIYTPPITTLKPRIQQTQIKLTTPKPREIITTKSTLSKSDICGTIPPISSPLIIGGQTILKGSWPWLVAIYLAYNKKNTRFLCGGNLITSKTILTSAHCIRDSQSELRSQDLLIAAGKHDINNWQEDSNQFRAVDRFFIHPDYKTGRYDADVAVIIVKETITFNDNVRPICLWNDDPDLNKIAGQNGTVVGWGRTRTQEVSPVPKKIIATIIDGLDCVYSNEYFFNITSKRTFCAGNRNGEGPCKGDSGGGLAIHRNEKWFLRGTVSAALGLKDGSHPQCDLTNYVVYSDVAKFIPWINSYLQF
ncbi:hypothetical protein ACFFRR_000523 [Megaselia abdita]